MTAVETEPGTLERGAAIGQSLPRKEDNRLVQGQGVFFDDIKRHGMGFLHFVRAPYAHAKIDSIDVSAALEIPGVYGTLTGDEVAILTDPFFQIAAAPGGNLKDYALAVGKVRYIGEPVVAVVAETRELARDAAELVEIVYEPLDVVVDARKALADGAPVLHEECGGNLSYAGVWEWGDVDAAFAEADHIVSIKELHFDRFNSTPLECDGAFVEYNRGTGQWTMYTNNQFPGFAAIMMGPAMRVGLDKLRIVTQDIGGGFGNKITTHPQLVVCCLLARKLKRPIQWTEWRTEFHQSMSHGNERWFQDTEVAVKADGTLLGLQDEGGRRRRRLSPLRAARRRDLGAGRSGPVPLAKHEGGLHAGDDEQGARLAEPRLLAHAAPVVHRARDRHRRPGAELRPGGDPESKNFIQPEQMPYETPNGCVYDSGDYPRSLDLVLDLIGYERHRRAARGGRGARQAARASASARRSTPARTTSASRS